MRPRARHAIAATLAALVAMALVQFFLSGDRLESLAMAICLILVWTPLKGVLYRRLGGNVPYKGAFVANTCSELIGLPFHLPLSFWAMMTVSFVVSALIESPATLAMSTARSLRRSLLLGFYGSFVVHSITAGWFAAQRRPVLGVALIIVGVVSFHLPTFFDDRWPVEPPPTA